MINKNFLKFAMVAAMAAPFAVSAGDVTVYGNVHVSIDSTDDDSGAAHTEPGLNSRTSAVGVKGKEDLGGGMTALFKVEWQIDPTNRCSSTSAVSNDAIADGGNGDGILDPDEIGSSGCNSMTDRDQWVGIKKSGMGTIKFGTMSSNYKQMGGKVDPMYRTALEGRATGMQQSAFHSGAGINRGRMTKAVQFTSTKIAGIQMVVNATVSGDDTDETIGAGLRYKTKTILAYVDWIDNAGQSSAAKLGGKFKMGATTIGAQYEATADAAGEDLIFLSVKQALGKNDWVALNFASASADVAGAAGNADGSGYALMFNHNMSKRTNTYVGYGVEDMADDGTDNERVTLGLRHKF